MKGKLLIIIIALLIIGIIILSNFTIITQDEIKVIKNKVDEVVNQPLSIRILADISSGTNPLSVNFRPLISNSKDELKYYWEFGDGNTSNEENPSYVYRNYGLYTCKLTVEESGTKKSDFINLTVFPNNPPKVKIKCVTTAFRPEKVFFDAEVFDPEGENLTYHWILTYPLMLGVSQRKDDFFTKNFSVWLVRNGRYDVELTVTDEVGNKVTDYEVVQVEKSKPENFKDNMAALITFTLPAQIGILWTILKLIKFENYLDNHWLTWPPIMKAIVKLILFLSMGSVEYEPPIPKAALEFSKINDLNLSPFVDDITGVVKPGAAITSSFTISNIDSTNTGKNIFVTLDDPFSENQGLPDEIEFSELTAGLDVGVMSNKLFYNGIYTSWDSCYAIEKLAPGDYIDMGISISLKEGSVFNKGSYNCTLYIYQEKSLDKEEYVDKIPFTIVI